VSTDAYLGKWELIPELCIYDRGEAPTRGLYTIAEAAGVVSISISWIDVEGEEHSISFSGASDGSPQSTSAPGLTHMTISRMSANTLDSAAFNGEDQTMYARRVAHDNLLSTLQRITSENGTFSIFQVYKRIAG